MLTALALALFLAACGAEEEKPSAALKECYECAGVAAEPPPKPVCKLIEPPPPPPEMILTNSSQFPFSELRFHPTANYRQAANILAEPFQLGRSMKMIWRDSLYVTIIRVKVEYGSRVAMTTPEALAGRPDATAHEVRIFDESFRPLQLTEFPRSLAPGDTAPPQFAGLDTIQSPPECPPFDDVYVGAEIVLTWKPALDDVTPSIGTVYEVCQSNLSGACAGNFIPAVSSRAGQQILKLKPDKPGEYFFTVRARDESGNVESNVVEKSIRLKPIPGTPDITPPTFAGVKEAGAVSSSEVALTWDPAVDDVTGTSAIWYQYCVSKTEGDCLKEFKAAGATYGTTFTVKDLTPGTIYYFVVWATDQAGNFDKNEVQVSVPMPGTPPTPEPPPSTKPVEPPPSGPSSTQTTSLEPTTTSSSTQTTAAEPPPAAASEPGAPQFAGLKSATLSGTGDVVLNWEAASDDVTPSSGIVYEICQSTKSGACAADFWAAYETSPGATSYVLKNFNPRSTYYFLVRARDADGKRDANTIERVVSP